MKAVSKAFTTLYNFPGSHNPYWRLTESSDVLLLHTSPKAQNLTNVAVSRRTGCSHQGTTVITSSLMMSLTVDESDPSCASGRMQKSINGMGLQRVRMACTISSCS
ncbi:hypothetical protein ACLB1Q_07300 [Escherichia coli]